MTPNSIRTLALERMDTIRKQIAAAELALVPMRAELAELTAWLDAAAERAARGAP